MALKIESESHITQRVAAMKRRSQHSRDIMRKLDLWRNMLKWQLERDIWHGEVPTNSAYWTAMSPYIAAVTDACVAMLSSERPQITTLPRNTYDIESQQGADYFEHLGAAIFDTLNANRSTTIETQTADQAISRANLIVKLTSLDPDDRGEYRAPVQPMLDSGAAYRGTEMGAPEEDGEPFRITEEGEFPILWQQLDALDCLWTLGKDDRIIEFAHCYQQTWDVLCDEFPDIYTKEKFKQYDKIDYSDTPADVIDYWYEHDGEICNAIMIGGIFYKKPHVIDLPFMPIVVEEVAVREVPVDGIGENQRRIRMGKPFCEQIIDLAAEESWYMSLGRSYIAAMPFATGFLTGVDVTDPRNFLTNRDSRSGDPGVEYTLDNSPGGHLQLLPPGVALEFPKPPDMVPVLQELKAWTSQSMQNLTMPQAVLSGDVPGDTSGYAYFQMKQVPMAKLGPYEIGCNRFLSRALEMVKKIIVLDWDRMDYPMLLSRLTGQQQEGTEQLEVSKEQLAGIGTIQVRMKVTLPTDKEQEDTAVLQKTAAGLMSATTAITIMGDVQDANSEWEQAIAQNNIAMNPDMAARITASWLDKRGYPSLQPRPQPQLPAPPSSSPPVPGGPVGMAVPPPGAMPMDPSMMGAPMPPEMAMQGAPPMGPQGPPMGPNGEVPPELLAILMAQGGGMPPG